MNKYNIKYLCALLCFAIATAACNQKEPIFESLSEESGYITINTEIDSSTRASLYEDTFPQTASIGFYLYEDHGDDDYTNFVAHSSDTNLNIKAYQSSAYTILWYYYYTFASSTAMSTIALRYDSGDILSYGYSPYQLSLEDPTAIPYDLNDRNDILMTGAVHTDFVNGDTATNTDIELNFEHCLSLINLELELSNPEQTDINITSFSVKSADDTIINNAGAYNLYTGVFTPDADTSTGIVASLSSEDVTDGYTTYFYVLPTNDLSLKLDFIFDALSMESSLILPSTTFEKGKSYTVKAKLDNYAKFSGTISINKDWTNGGQIDLDR